MTRRTPQLATRAARRERIAVLLRAEPARSNRSIALESASDPKTVGIVRGELERAGAIEPRTRTLTRQPHGGALLNSQPGNDRAVKSGVDSEHRLAPLRVEGELFARQRWPWLDAARVALVADLTARVELARRWIEARGIVRNRVGDVYPVVDRLERWSARLEGLIAKLDAEGRELAHVDPADALGAVVAEIVQSRNGGSDD